MVARTKEELKAEVDASITTNGQGEVTAAILRTVMHNFIDSMLADLDGAIQIADVENLQSTLDGLTGASGSGSALQLKYDTTTRAEATATGLKLTISTYADNTAALNAGLQAGELYMDSNGVVRAVKAAAVVLPNSVLVSQYDPVNSDKAVPLGPVWLQYFNKKWEHYSAGQPWCVSSTDDLWIRFETRQTDLYSSDVWTDPTGTNRNRMGEDTTVMHTPTDNFLIEGKFIVEAPSITSQWFQLMEIHTYEADGSATPTAYKCQLRIVNQKLQIDAPYDNGTASSGERILWADPSNIVYGKEYSYKLYCSGGGSTGRIIFELDGQRVLDFNGYVGFATEGQCSYEFGVYRGNNSSAWTPETNVTWHKIDVLSIGAVSAPAAPAQNPDTYGANLITAGNNGDMSVTTGWSATGATLASSGGELEITRSAATGSAMASTTFATTVGALYQLDAEMRIDPAGGSSLLAWLNVYSDVAAGNLNWAETNATTKQAVSFRFTADDTLLTLYLQNDDTVAGSKVYFDNVMVREVNPGS